MSMDIIRFTILFRTLVLAMGLDPHAAKRLRMTESGLCCRLYYMLDDRKQALLSTFTLKV